MAIAMINPDQLSAARHQLRDWAIGNGVDPHIAHDINAAAYEAMANSIEHAYRDRHGPVTIAAEYHIGPDHTGGTDGHGDVGEIRVVVRDEGSWSGAPTDIEWRGRGLELITALGGQLEIRVGVHGTTTTIRWTLG